MLAQFYGLCTASKIKKVGHTNFVKFLLQTLSPKIEQPFKKITKYVFISTFPTPTLTYFFRTFSITLKNIYISHLKSSITLCDEYHFYISITVIKVGKKLFFKQV